MPASDRERFELLYGMLKGYYQSLVDGALRVNGIFLIAAGWILTSSTPISYLERHAVARHAAIALVLVAHGLYLLIGPGSVRPVTFNEPPAAGARLYAAQVLRQ